jgi:hypothetical protein
MAQFPGVFPLRCFPIYRERNRIRAMDLGPWCGTAEEEALAHSFAPLLGDNAVSSEAAMEKLHLAIAAQTGEIQETGYRALGWVLENDLLAAYAHVSREIPTLTWNQRNTLQLFLSLSASLYGEDTFHFLDPACRQRQTIPRFVTVDGLLCETDPAELDRKMGIFLAGFPKLGARASAALLSEMGQKIPRLVALWARKENRVLQPITQYCLARSQDTASLLDESPIPVSAAEEREMAYWALHAIQVLSQGKSFVAMEDAWSSFYALQKRCPNGRAGLVRYAAFKLNSRFFSDVLSKPGVPDHLCKLIRLYNTVQDPQP